MNRKLLSVGTWVATCTLIVALAASTANAGTSWHLEPLSDGKFVSILNVDGVTTTYSAGDVNFDGVVNGQDITEIVSRWMFTGQYLPGDANADGFVNGEDIQLVNQYWGAGLPSGVSTGNQDPRTSPVPEFGTGIMFAAFATGLWVVRRCSRGTKS